MSGYYVETTENGNERTVFTFTSGCGDFPECHDETTPCRCNESTCKHCLRTLHPVTRDGVQVWADETNDPFYCPKARNLTHAPTDSASR